MKCLDILCSRMNTKLILNLTKISQISLFLRLFAAQETFQYSSREKRMRQSDSVLGQDSSLVLSQVNHS